MPVFSSGYTLLHRTIEIISGNFRKKEQKEWARVETDGFRKICKKGEMKEADWYKLCSQQSLEMLISTVMVWQERPFLKQTGEEKDVVEKRRKDQIMQVHGCPWKQWETFSPETVSTESPVENCRFRNLGCIYSHFCCLPAMDGLGFEAFSRTLSRENHETVSIAICLT